MIQVYRNNTPALNGGLNGWFGRLVKRLCQAAVDLVQNVPVVGSVFKAELTKLSEIVDGMNTNYRKLPDYEPTAAEAAILEPWASNRLNPFYKQMVTQLSRAFSEADVNVQLQQINNVVLKMCVVKQYFATNEIAGLSPDGVLSRMEIINRIFEPVEGLIAKSVAEYEKVLVLQPYSYAFDAITSVAFSPLIARATAVTNYTCNRYIVSSTANVKPVTTKPNLPGTKPGAGQVGTIKPTVPGTTLPSPTAPITTPTPAVPTTPGTTINPVTTKPAAKKKNYIGWFLGAIAAGFVANELLTEEKN